MRCFGDGKDFYETYHDTEWGVPVHDDQKLFEMLCLEGQQAGLSWEIVLKKRDAYRRAFHAFDPNAVAKMGDETLKQLCTNQGLIRHRLKLFSIRNNAQKFILIQKEFGSFDRYIWAFVNGSPIVNTWKVLSDVPCSSSLSDTIAADLKKRGMTFVGTKIMYSFVQAVGMVNDHLVTCHTRSRNFTDSLAIF